MNSAELQRMLMHKDVRHSTLIGIDPDVDKSGVCVFFRKEREMKLYNLTFFELFDILKTFTDTPTKVVVEAGWLNKSNWHLKNEDSKRVAAAKGKNTGENHETGRKIVEMCEYLQLDYQLIRPTKHKTDAGLFKQITGYTKRTNPEQRDAAMLVFE
jgi:hypothetical protein